MICKNILHAPPHPWPPVSFVTYIHTHTKKSYIWSKSLSPMKVGEKWDSRGMQRAVRAQEGTPHLVTFLSSISIKSVAAGQFCLSLITVNVFISMKLFKLFQSLLTTTSGLKFLSACWCTYFTLAVRDQRSKPLAWLWDTEESGSHLLPSQSWPVLGCTTASILLHLLGMKCYCRIVQY